MILDQVNGHGNGELRRVPKHTEQTRRTLPYNLDAEASIIGGVILRNELLAELEHVEIDDFYLHQHKVVFEAMRNLQARQQPIDVVTLEHEIEKRGKLDAIGGIAFLGELALRVPTTDNIIAYREIVKRLSANRRAIIELSQALESAYTWPHDPAELISETAGRLSRIEVMAAAPRVVSTGIDEALAEIAQLAGAPIYETPFETLNEALGFGGLLGTQTYTVVGGTGRGKTSFVTQIAMHAVERVPVILASWEMRPVYFLARRAAGVLGVHSNAILRGEVALNLVRSTVPYERLRLMHKRTLAELRDEIARVSDLYGTAPLVIADYLQKLAHMLAAASPRPDLRLATTQASATLGDIADRSRCAILTVSAVGRGKVALKNPRKHEPCELVEVAKESGDVEYDGAATIVLSLTKQLDVDERVGTISIAKARFGREMHIEARYRGERGLWRDLGEVTESDDDSAPARPSPATRDAREDVIRAAIIANVIANGPAANPTALKKRIVGFRKEAVGAAIQVMLDKDELIKIGGRIQLASGPRQTSMEPVQ